MAKKLKRAKRKSLKVVPVKKNPRNEGQGKLVNINVPVLLEGIELGAIAPYNTAIGDALLIGPVSTVKLLKMYPQIREYMDAAKLKMQDKAEMLIEEILDDNKGERFSEKTRGDMAKWLLERRNDDYKKDNGDIDREIVIQINGVNGI